MTGQEEVGASPEETPEEIRELVDEIRIIEDKNALIAGAYFHTKFENIHPFADGNGRTGRMATNYILITHNHLLIIIHEEDRKAYYSALESWDTNSVGNAVASHIGDKYARDSRKAAKESAALFFGTQ